MKFCCEDFKIATEKVLTDTAEDENTQKVTKLDGWYIYGAPYDSWYGHFGKYKKFKFCPWCGKIISTNK
jgi:hypothetical protein